VPGPRPWNLSNDSRVVVSRIAAASIFGSDDSGTAAGARAPVPAGCAAGAAACCAGAGSRLHPAATAEESTMVSATRGSMGIPALYGSLIAVSAVHP
jgi:hypothetical protein